MHHKTRKELIGYGYFEAMPFLEDAVAKHDLFNSIQNNDQKQSTSYRYLLLYSQLSLRITTLDKVDLNQLIDLVLNDWT